MRLTEGNVLNFFSKSLVQSRVRVRKTKSNELLLPEAKTHSKKYTKKKAPRGLLEKVLYFTSTVQPNSSFSLPVWMPVTVS